MIIFDTDKLFREHSIVQLFLEESFLSLFKSWKEAKKENCSLQIIDEMIYKGVDYVLLGEDYDAQMSELLDILTERIYNGKDISKSKSEREKITTMGSGENITTA